jgi:hypothetical protein
MAGSTFQTNPFDLNKVLDTRFSARLRLGCGPIGFKPRPVEGAPTEAKQIATQVPLFDGQQRRTSLYQAILRGKDIETKKKKGKR